MARRFQSLAVPARATELGSKKGSNNIGNHRPASIWAYTAERSQ
jgi:hypothetical protein